MNCILITVPIFVFVYVPTRTGKKTERTGRRCNSVHDLPRRVEHPAYDSLDTLAAKNSNERADAKREDARRARSLTYKGKVQWWNAERQNANQAQPFRRLQPVWNPYHADINR